MPTNTGMDACKLQLSKPTFHFRMRSHFLIMMHYILGIIALLLAKNIAAAMNSYLGLLQKENLASDYSSCPPPHNFLTLSTSFHQRGFSVWPLTKSRHTHLSGSCLSCSHFFIWLTRFCQHHRGAHQRERRDSAHLEILFSPLSFYFISSCMCFHCLCFFPGMRASKAEVG